MAHRMPQCVKHTRDMLEELERDREFEVLRKYLTEYRLFPRTRDPSTAPIRYEELKELVKHWKLHCQRNFWRNHTTKEDLVRTLQKHINTKVAPTVTTTTISATTTTQPTAPVTTRKTPSKVRERRQKQSLPYGGDVFSQRGQYDDGLVYLSRLERPEDAMAKQRELQEKALKLEREREEELARKRKQNQSVDKAALAAAAREKDMKRRCACSIFYITIEEGTEKAILQEGCMPAIVRLSLYDDADTKRFCAGAIVNLTCDLSNCHQMIDDGALTALSELAKSPCEEVRENVSTALCRTSYDQYGQTRLMQEGGVSSLLSMLGSQNFHTREACIKAMINVASFSESAIADTVIKTLVSTAVDAKALQDDNQELNYHANFVSQAVKNISLLSAAQAKAIDDGVLEAVQVLARTGTQLQSSVMENLAVGLSNFSRISANHESMGNPRGLECLKALLTCESEEVVKERCAVAISSLSCDKVVSENMVLNGIIPLLIQVGESQNVVIRESVSHCIANMAYISANRPLLAKEGAVKVLVQYLNDGNILTKKRAVTALCNLMMHRSTRDDVSKYHIVPCLVSLSASLDKNIRNVCALALYNLSCDDSLQALISQPNVVGALVKLSTDDDDDVKMTLTQQYCLGGIYNLSFDSTGCEVLISENVVKTLATLFKNGFNEENMQKCAAIICNISFNVSCRESLVKGGVVKLLQDIVRTNTSNGETLRCVATALCNVAIEAMTSTNNNLLNILLRLSTASQHTEVILSCAIALSKLVSSCSSDAIRRTVTECTEVAPALTVMMRSGNDGIQYNAACALCNLAREELRVAALPSIWRQGTVPDFIVNSLLRVNSNSTKEICAKALFNLLSHESTRSTLIDKGVLYALVKLSRLESVDIRRSCVVASYNVSCDSSMVETLMDMNITQVIEKMCESEVVDQDLIKMLSATLTNIALTDGTNSRMVDCGALNTVKLISEYSDDAFSLRHCGSILCSLVQCESGSIALASADELLAVVVKMASMKTTDTCQVLFGLNALSTVSCFPQTHEKLVGTALDVVFDTINDKDSGKHIVLACTQILCNLSYDARVNATLLQHGVISSLETLLTSKEGDLKSNDTVWRSIVGVIARVVAQICNDEDFVGTLNKTGAERVLSACAKLCKSDDSETIERCLIASCRLSRSEVSEESLVQDGVLDIIDKAIGFSAENCDKIIVPCSSILRNLSTYSFARETLLKDASAVKILGRLANFKNEQVYQNCSVAIYNLVMNARNLLELNTFGAIQVLIDLSKSGSNEVQQICAVAVAHLNSEITENRVSTGASNKAEDGLVSTLVTMLDMDQVTVQQVETIASSLANPTVSTGESWIFLRGTVGRPDNVTPLPIDWSTSRVMWVDSSMNTPQKTSTFLQTSSTIFAAAASDLFKNDPFGEFTIMKVRNEKKTVKKSTEVRTLGGKQATLKALNDLVVSSSDKKATTIDGDAKTEQEVRSAEDTSKLPTLSKK